jgi:hypothetical protein
MAHVEGLEQQPGRSGHVSNRGVESVLVRAGRGVEATDLPHELERRIVKLLVGRRVFRVSQSFDVSAHINSLSMS